MCRFVVPIAMVVLLGLGSLAALGLTVSFASHLPWLLILAGAWMLMRTDRRPVARPTGPSGPFGSMGGVSQAPQQRPVARPPAAGRPPARGRRELPIDAKVKVEQIRHKANVLMGFADRFPPMSRDLHIVRQTAAEYLPKTVAAYQALQGDDDLVVGSSGKTAVDELREQLALLDSKLDEIAQDLQRQDVERLLANRRFLEERFANEGRDEGKSDEGGTSAA